MATINRPKNVLSEADGGERRVPPPFSGEFEATRGWPVFSTECARAVQALSTEPYSRRRKGNCLRPRFFRGSWVDVAR
jgi:hypothetical protein